MKAKKFACLSLNSSLTCSLQQVCVRYVGFGREDDEWVNVKNDVRERSIPLEHSECKKVEVGDLVVCFQVCVLIYVGYSSAFFTIM